MKSETQIKVDLAHPSIGTRVEAMQGDGNTRCITVQLLDDGKPWHPPADAEIAVAYTQPGGTKGFYNQLPDGSPAVRVNGSKVTILLASAMLRIPGRVSAAVVFNNPQLDQLTSFPFTVTVTESPYVGAQQAEDYIRLQWLEDKLEEKIAELTATEKAVAAAAAAERADVSAVTAREQAIAADTAATAAYTAAAGANLAKVTAETAAVDAQAQAAAAEIAAGNANAAAQGADTARDAANAAAAAANQAAAAAQEVIDTVAPEVQQLKQYVATHGEALDNRIKKFYTSNLGATSIADSDDGAIRNLVIYGKNEQQTTKGYQMFDTKSLFANSRSATSAGLTFAYDADQDIFTITGTATVNAINAYILGDYNATSSLFTLPAGTYTFSVTSGYGCLMYSYDGTVRRYANILPGGNTITFETDFPITALKPVNREIGKTYDEAFRIMIECGEVAHEWEPYTGGVPSPSTEYPQEIQSVVNPVLRATGKNLLREVYVGSSAAPYNSCLVADISDLLPGTRYTISFYQAAGHNMYLNEKLFEEFHNRTGIGGLESFVVTTKSSISRENTSQHDGRGWILAKNHGNNTVVPDFRFVQMEFGETATPYVPYKVQTAEIPLVLNGIGDVRDALYVYADGTGKLVRRFPETLDSTKTVAEQALTEPIETLLTPEQVRALFDLRTYYGGTNISFTTENGVEPAVHFDYACSLENFVAYTKAAQGDDRKFIYDMEDRMTDAEYLAAMAYVNSEYAAALTELEG